MPSASDDAIAARRSFPGGFHRGDARPAGSRRTFSPHLSRSIIEEETGQTIDALISRFDDEPMAAASMAQVHCAVLHGGEHVIVKVQRPDIARTVEADIAVLRRAVRVLSTVVSSLH